MFDVCECVSGGWGEVFAEDTKQARTAPEYGLTHEPHRQVARSLKPLNTVLISVFKTQIASYSH